MNSLMTSLTTTDAQIAMVRSQAEQAKQMAAAMKAKGINIEKIDAAARDFEAVFLSSMMKPMFEGIEPDPLFGGGNGEEIFQDLMLDEYGKNMAANGGVGIADMVRAEMIRQQEGAAQ
jgi:Rod binding domain-containing protein